MIREQITPAAYIIFLSKCKKKILLGRRIHQYYGNGLYSLPSGHLEKNESFLNAACREALEETGVIINPKSLHLAHTSYRESISTNFGSRIDLFFTCESWEGEIENKEVDKCHGWEWHPITLIPTDTVPFVAGVLKLWLAGINYSEYNAQERINLKD